MIVYVYLHGIGSIHLSYDELYFFAPRGFVLDKRRKDFSEQMTLAFKVGRITPMLLTASYQNLKYLVSYKSM